MGEEKESIDRLLNEYKSPEEAVGKNGLLNQLIGPLVRRIREEVFKVGNRLHGLGPGIELLRQRDRRSVEILAGDRIDKIQRLGQIHLLHQMAAEAAHIGCFENKAAAKLMLHREIGGQRIGRLNSFQHT